MITNVWLVSSKVILASQMTVISISVYFCNTYLQSAWNQHQQQQCICTASRRPRRRSKANEPI